MKALQLKQTFKTNVADIYALSGDDEGMISFALEKFYALIPYDMQAYCIQKFEGSDIDQNDVLASLSYVSMFGDRRLVIVEDFNKKLNLKESEAWLDYAENTVEGNILVLVNCPTLKTVLNQYAVEVDCNKMGLLDYVNYIQTLFNFYKIKYDKSALSLIVNRCNKDFGKINNELNKIMLYAGSEILVDESVIDDVVAPDTETQVFEFIYAIQDFNYDKAMGIIDVLLKRGDKPSAILAMLTLTFKRMFAIMTNDGGDDFLCESLGMKKNALFMTRKKIDETKRKVSGFLGKLKDALYYLYQLEFDFKSGKISQDSALDLAITHLMGKTYAK